jgi:hypothetical protein
MLSPDLASEARWDVVAECCETPARLRTLHCTVSYCNLNGGLHGILFELP